MFSKPDASKKTHKELKAELSSFLNQGPAPVMMSKDIDLGEMLTASGGKDSHNVRARVLDFGGFSDTEETDQDKLFEQGEFERTGASWANRDSGLLNKRLDDKFELLLSNPRPENESSSLRKRENLLTLWSGIKEGIISWEDISFPPAVVERFLKSNVAGTKMGAFPTPLPTPEATAPPEHTLGKPQKRVKKN